MADVMVFRGILGLISGGLLILEWHLYRRGYGLNLAVVVIASTTLALNLYGALTS